MYKICLFWCLCAVTTVFYSSGNNCATFTFDPKIKMQYFIININEIVLMK